MTSENFVNLMHFTKQHEVYKFFSLGTNYLLGWIFFFSFSAFVKGQPASLNTFRILQTWIL